MPEREKKLIADIIKRVSEVRSPTESINTQRPDTQADEKDAAMKAIKIVFNPEENQQDNQPEQ